MGACSRCLRQSPGLSPGPKCESNAAGAQPLSCRIQCQAVGAAEQSLGLSESLRKAMRLFEALELNGPKP